MNCTNHPEKEATKICVGCGNFFCDDCLTKIKNKNYCKDCVSDLLEEKQDTKEEDKKASPQIIIQQQQQQQQSTSRTDEKPKGSYCWLCFWLVVFFPAAIIYALIRRWD